MKVENKHVLYPKGHLNITDNILEPFTTYDIITAVVCNEKIITKETVKEVTNEILQSNLEDFWFLFDLNVDRIIEIAKKERKGM